MSVAAQARQSAAKTPVTPAPQGLLHRKCECGGKVGLDGMCDKCRETRLARKRDASSRDPHAVPAIVHDVLRSTGDPLDPSTRAFMESRFGHDFSQVRIHTGARADESAKSVGALAYAAGSSIVFARNAYAPATDSGRRLIAHELTHVAQQSDSGGALPSSIAPADSACEREADAMAAVSYDRATYPPRARIRNSLALLRDGLEIRDPRPKGPAEEKPKEKEQTLDDLVERDVAQPAADMPVMSAKERARVDVLVRKIREFVATHPIDPDRGWLESTFRFGIGPQEHGRSMAQHLVTWTGADTHLMRLAFGFLQATNPALLSDALYEGWTIGTLHKKGLYRFEDYRAKEEGFLTGLIRAGSEAKALPAAERKPLEGLDILAATAGFAAGVLQGVGDSIIENTVGLLELLTPKFWADLRALLFGLVPRAIADDEFGYYLAQMLVQGSAGEDKVVAALHPAEYGLRKGQTFGAILTEIVLSFIGLGFVMKGLRASKVTELRNAAAGMMRLERWFQRGGLKKLGVRMTDRLGEAVDQRTLALEKRVRGIEPAKAPRPDAKPRAIHTPDEVLASAPAHDPAHTLSVRGDGRITRCSPPPCSTLRLDYGDLIAKDARLAAHLDELEALNRRAAASGNDKELRAALAEARQFESRLARLRQKQLGPPNPTTPSPAIPPAPTWLSTGDPHLDARAVLDYAKQQYGDVIENNAAIRRWAKDLDKQAAIAARKGDADWASRVAKDAADLERVLARERVAPSRHGYPEGVPLPEAWGRPLLSDETSRARGLMETKPPVEAQPGWADAGVSTNRPDWPDKMGPKVTREGDVVKSLVATQDLSPDVRLTTRTIVDATGKMTDQVTSIRILNMIGRVPTTDDSIFSRAMKAWQAIWNSQAWKKQASHIWGKALGGPNEPWNIEFDTRTFNSKRLHEAENPTRRFLEAFKKDELNKGKQVGLQIDRDANVETGLVSETFTLFDEQGKVLKKFEVTSRTPRRGAKATKGKKK